MAYSLVQLGVNGVILDETVIPAQVIAGTVQYPPGHPHRVYHPAMFSLSNYLGAAQIKLFPDPLALSAVRNVISLRARLKVLEERTWAAEGPRIAGFLRSVTRSW
jgi:hypothetical protein